MQGTRPLLSVEDLKTYFANDEGLLRAVDGVSFTIGQAESLGVVGESGCGKSVTAHSIMNLLPQKKTRRAGGHIYFSRDGNEVIDLAALGPNDRTMRSIRGNDIAMVFQEPMNSLNPVFTVGEQIVETIRQHQKLSREEARAKTIELLDRVGISAPGRRVDEYPFELSGGMRQRVLIAIALSCNPRILIADEPTTALDVTVEAQILELIKDLQREYNMALMMITHDLGVISETVETVIVMYMGKIVERASVDDIFYDPKHPYTRALLRSLPILGSRRRLRPIGGSVPNPYLLPDTCAFAPRCPDKSDLCSGRPKLIKVGDEHYVSCDLFR